MEFDYTQPGAVLLRKESRIFTGVGVRREWKAYTLGEARRALEEMREFPGWKMGYLSYDFGAALERGGTMASDDFGTPFLHFVAPEKVETFEVEKFQFPETSEALRATPPRGDLTREEYENRISRIHHYLSEGETYEVNFAQRFCGEFEGDPWAFFLRLYALNPSPHACFLDFNPVTVVSCSPERLARGFFRKDGRMEVDTRPIKGTAPRGATQEEDRDNINELLASPKNEAELNMIVDLARNDLGKVCEIGSVEVNEHRAIETYSHVHHTMSNVRGILEQRKDWLDVLEAVFPGGSVTGAPKKRTMKIIEELEPCARGIYTGSAGFISPEGEFDFNILIRTCALQREQGRYRIHSGGAIVMDSVADREYRETMDKAAVLFEAMR